MSWRTAKKWAERYRLEGEAGMVDRSSKPHYQPNRTPARRVKKIVDLRIRLRLGSIEIADRLGMTASTVHAVLVRWRLNRLTHLDRIGGEPIRRYERDRPEELLHMDVKKLGNIPDGGAWRYVGRPTRRQEPSRDLSPHRRSQKHLPPAVDRDLLPSHRHRRPLTRPYLEARDDETKDTAVEVLRNAIAWFAARGVTVEQVLTDNGGCYRSHLWRDTCTELGITHKRTRPYRPQTNAKIERLHHTLAQGGAFKKLYPEAPRVLFRFF